MVLAPGILVKGAHLTPTLLGLGFLCRCCALDAITRGCYLGLPIPDILLEGVSTLLVAGSHQRGASREIFYFFLFAGNRTRDY